MLLLGLGDHVDCGSALLDDGKLVAAINDERLVREKMVFGIPRESIRAVLDLVPVRRARAAARAEQRCDQGDGKGKPDVNGLQGGRSPGPRAGQGSLG